MTARTALLAGGVFSALSVILGAFGAHALKDRIQPEQLQSFETGVRYQFYHGLALILTGIIASRSPESTWKWPMYLFFAGTILFSLSIYLLSTREILGIESWKSILGPITPIGGLCLIIGWCLFCFSALKSTETLN
ncbi:MAG: DUF423 domain-containing protein [Bacteroidota bacterium]